jgi:hypothetical protein
MVDTADDHLGSLTGKDDIYAFFEMTDRLGIEQQEKMRFLSPNQDWLDLAEKLTDEELNQLVDAVDNISGTLFSELKEGESFNGNYVATQLNDLSTEELLSTISVMTRLSEQSNAARNADPMKSDHGNILANYSELIFGEERLSGAELNTVNERLATMDYSAATGLIDAVRLLAEEPKQQLFDLLDNSSIEDNEVLSGIFSYIGSLTSKALFISEYNVSAEDGETLHARVSDEGLNDHEKKSLIENIFTVVNQEGLEKVNDIIKQTSVSVGAIQSNFWSTVGENSQEMSFDHEAIATLLLEATSSLSESHEGQIRKNQESFFSMSSRGKSTFNLIG